MDKIIFIPTQKPQAQGGPHFLAFHTQPCADVLRFLSAIDFGALLVRLVMMTIFFKLQAGMSLVSSAPHCARPAPRHAHATPKINRLKSLYSTSLDSLLGPLKCFNFF